MGQAIEQGGAHKEPGDNLKTELGRRKPENPLPGSPIPGLPKISVPLPTVCCEGLAKIAMPEGRAFNVS